MIKATEYKMAEEFKAWFAVELSKVEDYKYLEKLCEIAGTLDYLYNASPIHSIKWYAMGIATLSCFYCNEEYGQFWIPSTKTCCEKYRKIKRLISNNKPVTMDLGIGWDYENDKADLMSVRIA